jgi:hypothetical protein
LLGTFTPARSAHADSARPELTRPEDESAHTESVPGDIKNQCADAYEATQRERAAGHLLVARKNGIFCAQNSCPEVLRSDCAKWSDELASSTPSLVIEVRSPNGELLSNVQVSVDGTLFAEHLDGRSLEIDPGRHHFRFEALGLSPQEEDVVLLEGNQTQHLRVLLALVPVKAPPPRGIPLGSYVLGSAGVLGLGSFAFFGLTGEHKKNELDECKPACDSGLKAPIQRDFLAADISLGASIVSLGIATWIAIASQSAPPDPEKQAFRLRAGTDGALLSFLREF